MKIERVNFHLFDMSITKVLITGETIACDGDYMYAAADEDAEQIARMIM